MEKVTGEPVDDMHWQVQKREIISVSEAFRICADTGSISSMQRLSDGFLHLNQYTVSLPIYRAWDVSYVYHGRICWRRGYVSMSTLPRTPPHA